MTFPRHVHSKRTRGSRCTRAARAILVWDGSVQGPQWVFQGGCCVSNLKTFKSNWLWAWASWASFELSPVITGLQWNKIFFLQCLKMICNIFQCHMALFEWKPLQITGFYLDLTLNSLWHLIAKECCCCCSTCTPKCWKYGGICSFSAWFKNCY